MSRHVAPEAVDHGPIAAVREGDSITIDIEHGRIDLDLPAEALAQRLTEYVPPPPRYWSGVFVKYVATGTGSDYL